MTTKVKICGVTNVSDAVYCEKQGADFLGFIFSKSKRKVSPEKVKNIVSKLNKKTKIIGVFINEPYEFIRSAVEMCSLNYIQLHGDEDKSFIRQASKIRKPIIKVIRYKKGVSLASKMKKFSEAKYFLVDTYQRNTYGGTGKLIDYKSFAKNKTQKKLFVAGGLKPDNVRRVIGAIEPFALDVSSGVELRPGKKSRILVNMFIKIVKDYEKK